MGDIHGHRYKRLIDLLKKARKAKKLTQQDVADRLGRLQGYVSKYENGEREISLLDFFEIAEALGIDPFKLLRQWQEATPVVTVFR